MRFVAKAALFRRMDRLELAACLAMNRVCRRGWVESAFHGISRLGDGVFWYVLAVLLPVLYGRQGLIATLHMSAAGLAA